ELVEVLVRLEVGLLDEILGVLRVARHAVRGVVERVEVRHRRLLEGRVHARGSRRIAHLPHDTPPRAGRVALLDCGAQMPGSTPLPTTERLLDLVDRFAGREVVLLADLVADRFITGTPKRISREAPVLILRHESDVLTPGGGANAIANVAALGG